MLEKPITIMLIGGGGREHALAWKLSQSKFASKIICIPGNGGTSSLSKVINVADLNISNFAGIADLAIESNVDLVVIGPDNPLADGIVDYLNKRGLRVFGPKQESARLEFSKSFAKEFMLQHSIPTARFFKSDNLNEALELVRVNPYLRVVKADGLALGKGVFVCENLLETEEALRVIFEEKRFGESGSTVVLEEKLEGEELSLLMFCDGKTLSLMPACQDHKRRFEADTGPNTGGMGAYAPVALFDKFKDEILSKVINPLQRALSSGDLSYCGIIFVGLLLGKTSESLKNADKETLVLPYVLEFNARFGDPETQAIMPLLDSDLVEIFWACTEGKLAEQKISWSSKSACVVVACAKTYPEGSSKGELINFDLNLSDEKFANSVQIFHAGTKVQLDSASNSNTCYITSGGRVLAVSAIAETLEKAIDRSYLAMNKIHFADIDFRRDIGRRALSKCL